MKTIKLGASVTSSNDRDAEALRSLLREKGILLINLMSSPGSGKTTLLSRLIKDLPDLSIAVMEADIESDVDAITIESLGAQAIQVHTSGMCHMDAGMTTEAVMEILRDCNAEPAAKTAAESRTDTTTSSQTSSRPLPDILFLENVGNLICPAEYDTGAALNLMILSIPEGDDKPLKYPLMFQKSDGLVLSKLDALPYFPFDLESCTARARKLHPDIPIFPLSAKTGDGMAALENWLRLQLAIWRRS